MKLAKELTIQVKCQSPNEVNNFPQRGSTKERKIAIERVMGSGETETVPRGLQIGRYRFAYNVNNNKFTV